MATLSTRSKSGELARSANTTHIHIFTLQSKLIKQPCSIYHNPLVALFLPKLGEIDGSITLNKTIPKNYILSRCKI